MHRNAVRHQFARGQRGVRFDGGFLDFASRPSAVTANRAL
jgi:hypothetical protein